ncbi:MAG: hypothetical protein IH797_03360 [Chloroflexi bacterium]|nr:hypothetical protein [Chloroflexota bacterium]
MARKELWIANGLTLADWVLLRSPAERFRATDTFNTTSATFVPITSGTGDAMSFTAPFDGAYFVIFTASVSTSNAATELEIAMFINGVELKGWQVPGTLSRAVAAVAVPSPADGFRRATSWSPPGTESAGYRSP